MAQATGAARRDKRDFADLTHCPKLLDVVTVADAIFVHAVKDDLARTARLHLYDPLLRKTGCIRRALRVAGVLVHLPLDTIPVRIDTDDNALSAKTGRQVVDEFRLFQGRRIDRYLVGASVEYFCGIAHATYAACDTEGQVEDFRHGTDPTSIDRTPVGACRNVVKHQLIGTFVTIAAREVDNVSDYSVVRELNAFDDLAIANVEARNNTLSQNCLISSSVMWPSSSALPVMAPLTPASRSARKSSTLLTPPDA